MIARKLMGLGLMVIALFIGLWLGKLSFFPSHWQQSDLDAVLPTGFTADPARGELAFRAGGCANCHSPDPLADQPVLSGGKALEVPQGKFWPSNITPSIGAGIGAWTDAEFVTAMTKGVSPDGKHYYPAFPYTAYGNVAVTDLLDLKAYLGQLPVDDTASPSHELSFPFNLRFGLGPWKRLLVPNNGLVEPLVDPSPLDRGRYLAEGLGHCSTCHTPRNWALAEDKSRAYHGAEALKAGEFDSPKLAGEPFGKILGGMDEFAFSVRETSAMHHVTMSYSIWVPFEDHEAIATYLSEMQLTAGPSASQ